MSEEYSLPEEPETYDYILPSSDSSPAINDANQFDPLACNAEYSPKPKSKKRKLDVREELLSLIKDHFKERAKKPEEDRFDILGKYLALRLRNLGKVQRVLAEKMLNEVLCEAELGALTTDHKVVATSNLVRFS